MAFNKIIIKTSEGLNEIYFALQRFNPDIFIYSVKYGNVDNEKLIILTGHITDYIIKLQKEYGFLVSFGDKFLTIFGTDDNQRFTVTNKLLNRMKCGIKMTKDLYSLFCPKQSRLAARLYELYNKETPSIWNKSFITTSTYSHDMFGIESFSSEIQDCYSKMKEFFDLLQKCIKYCQYVIKREQEIRKDPDYCEYLYKNQILEMMNSVTDLLIGIRELDEDIFIDNPILQGRMMYGDTKRNLQENFHRCTPTQLRQALLYDLYHNEDLRNIPQATKKLFKNDINRIRLAYKIVDNFDYFVIGKEAGKSVGKEIVAMFVYWCGTNDVKNTVDFLKNNYHGNYKIVGPTDVYDEYNKLVSCVDQNEIMRNTQYNNFTRKIEEFIPSIANVNTTTASPVYVQMPQNRINVNI